MTVSLSSTGVRGVDVEQSPPALSLQEGASYTLQCNFSTSPQSVNWYLQNSGGHLIQLFYIPSGTKQDGRLKATTAPAERRSSLHISSSQTTDSGTYFCAAQHSAPQAPAACTQTCSRGSSHTLLCRWNTHIQTHTHQCVHNNLNIFNKTEIIQNLFFDQDGNDTENQVQRDVSRNSRIFGLYALTLK